MPARGMTRMEAHAQMAFFATVETHAVRELVVSTWVILARVRMGMPIVRRVVRS